MNLVNCLQFRHELPKTIFNGFFAWETINDYRADWALIGDIEQLDKINTIQRNPE